MSKHIWVMVDVESDGPAPGLYSMVNFGAIKVGRNLEDKDKFKSQIFKPISEDWIPDALAISGITREQMNTEGKEPELIMKTFKTWLESLKKDKDDRLRFISDNNGYDFMFINWYFWRYLNENPFGWSSANLGNLYQGLNKNVRKSFRHLRKTKHDHDPLNDAMGNVEALLHMIESDGLYLPL